MEAHIITLTDPRDCLLYRNGPGGTVEIVDIVVMSDRRVGKGRELIRQLIELNKPSQTFYAFTRKSNVIAQQFYTALGFEMAAVVRDFYSTDKLEASNHALMYVKRIVR